MEKKRFLPHQRKCFFTTWMPNLTTLCLHKLTDSRFHQVSETDKKLTEKIREVVFDGHSIVFARKAVVDETFIPGSTNLCKSVVGFDASRFYL